MQKLSSSLAVPGKISENWWKFINPSLILSLWENENLPVEGFQLFACLHNYPSPYIKCTINVPFINNSGQIRYSCRQEEFWRPVSRILF